MGELLQVRELTSEKENITVDEVDKNVNRFQVSGSIVGWVELVRYGEKSLGFFAVVFDDFQM